MRIPRESGHRFHGKPAILRVTGPSFAEPRNVVLVQ